MNDWEGVQNLPKAVVNPTGAKMRGLETGVQGYMPKMRATELLPLLEGFAPMRPRVTVGRGRNGRSAWRVQKLPKKEVIPFSLKFRFTP